VSKVKYHINPETGNPSICTASARDCRYAKNGVTPEHYETKEEAMKTYESKTEKELGVTKTFKKKRSSKGIFSSLVRKMKSSKVDYPTDDFSKYYKYITKDDSWHKVCVTYFKEDLKFETPSWVHAKTLGMASIRISDTDEIFSHSYNYHIEEYAEEKYIKSPILVENFLVRDGKPIAYYSFVAASKQTDDPPMIHTAEVRKGFRGQKLSNYFKKELNKILKVELHSNGVYTESGYRSIEKSPIWVKSPLYENNSSGVAPEEEYTVFKSAGRNVSYVENWDALASKDWASDW